MSPIVNYHVNISKKVNKRKDSKLLICQKSHLDRARIWLWTFKIVLMSQIPVIYICLRWPSTIMISYFCSKSELFAIYYVILLLTAFFFYISITLCYSYYCMNCLFTPRHWWKAMTGCLNFLPINNYKKFKKLTIFYEYGWYLKKCIFNVCDF